MKKAISIERVAIAVAFTLIGALGGLILAPLSTQFDFATPLSTLVGAFVGAWSAFLLEERARAKQQYRQDVVAANSALLAIFQYWNTLRQYQLDDLEKFRDHEDAWLNLNASPLHHGPEGRVALDSLGFLLEHRKFDLYFRLALEEKKFNSAISLINMRSEILLNDLWHQMQGKGIQRGDSLDAALVMQWWPATVTKLMNLTRDIFRNVDEDVKSLRAICEELRDAFSTIFPDECLVGLQFHADKNGGNMKDFELRSAPGPFFMRSGTQLSNMKIEVGDEAFLKHRKQMVLARIETANAGSYTGTVTRSAYDPDAHPDLVTGKRVQFEERHIFGVHKD